MAPIKWIEKNSFFSSSRRSQITTVHFYPIICLRGKTCTRLVPPVVWGQPPCTRQYYSTRPHGSHRNLVQRRNKVGKHGITPPRRCCTSRSGKIVNGMGSSSSNGPASHPGRELHQRSLDSYLDTIHHSPFPERN